MRRWAGLFFRYVFSTYIWSLSQSLVLGSVFTLPLNSALSVSPMTRHAEAEWLQSACEPRMFMTSLLGI